MSEQNNLNNIEPEIRKSLAQGRLVTFETHGISMLPLLHDGGDKVVLKRPEGKLNINDVALCKTDANRFVLHRVVAFEGDGYRLLGDNCSTGEFCPNDSMVTGVAVGFVRRGKQISVESFSYKFYVRHRRLLLKLWQLFWYLGDNFFALVKKQRK